MAMLCWPTPTSRNFRSLFVWYWMLVYYLAVLLTPANLRPDKLVLNKEDWGFGFSTTSPKQVTRKWFLREGRLRRPTRAVMRRTFGWCTSRPRTTAPEPGGPCTRPVPCLRDRDPTLEKKVTAACLESTFFVNTTLSPPLQPSFSLLKEAILEHFKGPSKGGMTGLPGCFFSSQLPLRPLPHGVR